ncbi:FMRFamide receptor [Adelges cooleyi]|uniref:FMRFamide receptor n=1 Tax=Adelges cooleyi TaxID=133065 RepID=UPI00217F6DC0|nr:FMRFamide receptor [Adelges cooleyi]XP_050442207.1 FMRFamide receptor [Adelges cooleyi]XP_050442208.1 FMRFamide receptor [Adelges cooleyi]
MNDNSSAPEAVADNNNCSDYYDNSGGGNSSNLCPVFSTADGDEYSLLFEFITYGILLNVIGVFGILGNVISMIILSRPQMKSSINYLLIGLARCDTVLIITSMLLFGLQSIYPSTTYLFNYYYKVYPLIAPVVYPIAMISQTVSVYLTLTVTLERFVAVCHPLRARSLCTYGRARAYVVVIIVFSVVYNITRFWEVRVHKCIHPEYDQYVYQVYPSPLRNDKSYISIYIHWMYLVIMYFIPFGSLAVLNAAIYNQVRMANRERQRLSRLQKKEIGLATMLLCVVVVFLLCNVWALISNIIEAFYGITVDELVKVSNLLVTINSSVNFVIYVIFGEKFKRLFFKLFFPGGFWMCGWHPPGGPRGTDDYQADHAAIDDSVVSYNGGVAGGHHHHHHQLKGGGLECRHQLQSSSVRRSHSCHLHRSACNKFKRSRSHCQTIKLIDGPNHPGDRVAGERVFYSRKSNSGVWETSTTTTTNVHQI